jgi:peroxiredoxin
MTEPTLFWVSYALLWALLIFQGTVLLELTRQAAERRSLPTGLAAPVGTLKSGTVVPDFELAEVPGGRLRRSTELHGRKVLLGVVSPTCATCEPAVRTMGLAAEANQAELVLLCQGDWADCADFAAARANGHIVLCDQDQAVGELLGVREVPGALLVDESWRVLKYGRPVSEDNELLLTEYLTLTAQDGRR